MRSPLLKGKKTLSKKGKWTPEEDQKLIAYVKRYGIWNWSQMPRFAGLSRSGKSCRLRWLNYLSPDVKHGNFTLEEEETIIRMYQNLGSRWSVIAKELRGRTDNEIKNFWHTRLKKRFHNNNLVPKAQSPAVELLSFQASSGSGSSSQLENSQEEIINNGSVLIYHNDGEVVSSSPESKDSTDWSFASDHHQAEEGIMNNIINNGDSADQIPAGDWTLVHDFMEEDQADQLAGFVYTEFDHPLWSVDPLTPSSCFYNDAYCHMLFNLPQESGGMINLFQEHPPIYLFETT